MKYIKTFESHRHTEPVNEEFLGALGKLIGNLFNKAKQIINKTKGGKDIEAIYNKYLGMINDAFTKQANVNLHIISASEQQKDTQVPPTENKTGATSSVNASYKYSSKYKINEADEPDANSKIEDVKILKDKKGVIDQIIKKYKDMALKEMDAVLKKYGGASKNPQLQIIINSKKDQFDLDYLNAQISYLEQSGDKTQIGNITKQRDIISKKIQDDFKNIDTVKAIEYKEGDEAIYLLDGKEKKEWDALSDEEKGKPKEGKAAEIVGVAKITKVDGDNYTLDNNGEVLNKTSSDIVSKASSGINLEQLTKYKDDKTPVIYKRKEFNEAEWNKLTDEEKKNPPEDKKELLKVDVKPIENVDKDTVSFKDNEGNIFTKTYDDIIGPGEAKSEEAKDAAVSLGKIKDNPDKMNKIANYADFLLNDENKDKIDQIQKIIGGNEEAQ